MIDADRTGTYTMVGGIANWIVLSIANAQNLPIWKWDQRWQASICLPFIDIPTPTTVGDIPR